MEQVEKCMAAKVGVQVKKGAHKGAVFSCGSPGQESVTTISEEMADVGMAMNREKTENRRAKA